jgi:SAM-dependent methyltransferase
VLDLGCGDGFFAQAVYGHLDTGIDMDEGEVARAIRRGTYDRALIADAGRMPFDDGSFHTVISNCVMEHIPHIDEVLSEVHRVLKPGGRLLTTVPSEYWNDDSFYQWIFRSLGMNWAARWYNGALNWAAKHFHVDERQVWEKRFEHAGLRTVSAEYVIPRRVFHAFERWLLPAAPSKLWKALFKRWVLLPRFWVPGVFRWWFKGLMEEKDDKGVCYFLIAMKPKKRS